MAKPLNNNEIPGLSLHYTTRDTSTSRLPPKVRKRGAQELEYTASEDSFISRDYPDEVHKTRRVNPQRLAARLEPGLVAEMEAYIIPGAKMPNFAIRKDFQERYSVDRRHIYDYFHSRGLRVAKEDKHTNLRRGRIARYIARGSPEKYLVEHEDEDISKDELNETQNESEKSLFFEQLPERRARRIASAKISATKPRRCLGPRTKRATRLLPKDSSLDGPLDVSLADDEVADDEDSIYDAPPSPHPKFTLPEEYPDTPSPDMNTFVSIFDPSPGMYEISDDYNINPPEICHKPDPLMFIDEHRPLTQEERMTLYSLINNSISPPGKIEECKGTYSAYMKEQSRNYFERLTFKAPHSYTTRPNYIKHEAETETKTVDEEVDFQKWLSDPVEQKLHQIMHIYPGQSTYTPLPPARTQDGYSSVPIVPDQRNGTNEMDPSSRGSANWAMQDKSYTSKLQAFRSSIPTQYFKLKRYQDQHAPNYLEAGRLAVPTDEATTSIERKYDHLGIRSMPYNIPSRLRTASAGGGI